MRYISKQSGYTLLFAVITAALVLGIAAFVLDITRKEYILASTARDSIYSFYAADSGIECVAASKGDIFGDISGDPPTNLVGSWNGGSCDYQSPDVTYAKTDNPSPNVPGAPSDATIYQATFSLGFAPPGVDLTEPSLKSLWGCADITIDQYYDDSGDLYQFVSSRGYNFCTLDGSQYEPDTSNPETVERGVQWEVHVPHEKP